MTRFFPNTALKGGVRGKYAERYQGTNLVCLDPDVYAFFGNSDAVNSALRALMSIIQEREAKAEAKEAA
ncbi:MAG TPA: hypothetical protein VFS20_15900 [Longimicrobium sp.]|nr:hypothetical protein [Longimicrobium sp.]